MISNSEKLLGDSQLLSSSESLPYTDTSFQHHSEPSITQLCLDAHHTCGPAQDSFPPSTLLLPNLLCCLFPHSVYISYPFHHVKTHRLISTLGGIKITVGAAWDGSRDWLQGASRKLFRCMQFLILIVAVVI